MSIYVKQREHNINSDLYQCVCEQQGGGCTVATSKYLRNRHSIHIYRCHTIWIALGFMRLKVKFLGSPSECDNVDWT